MLLLVQVSGWIGWLTARGLAHEYHEDHLLMFCLVTKVIQQATIILSLTRFSFLLSLAYFSGLCV